MGLSDLQITAAIRTLVEAQAAGCLSERPPPDLFIHHIDGTASPVWNPPGPFGFGPLLNADDRIARNRWDEVPS